MKWTRSHVVLDRMNAEQDRIIARRLRRDEKVLDLARQNLRRWMRKDGKRPRPVFVEWHNILERLSRRQIADFLMSDTPMAQRLRQSSPFSGVLSGSERAAIRRKYD